MAVVCECNDWKEQIPMIEKMLSFSRRQSPQFIAFRIAIYVYCPYCGKKLEEKKQDKK